MILIVATQEHRILCDATAEPRIPSVLLLNNIYIYIYFSYIIKL